MTYSQSLAFWRRYSRQCVAAAFLLSLVLPGFYPQLSGGVAAASCASPVSGEGTWYYRHDNAQLLTDDSPVLTLTGTQFFTKPGRYWLTFYAEQTRRLVDTTKGVVPVFSREGSVLDVSLNGGGSIVALGRAEMRPRAGYAPYSFLVTVPDSAHDVLLAKERDPEEGNQISVLGLEMRAISDSPEDPAPVRFGLHQPDPAILSTLGEKLSTQFQSLRAKGTAVGQLFKAEHDYLSAVDLCLSVHGTGGEGGYRLELHHARPQGAGYAVDSPVLAALDFGGNEAQKYAAGGGAWHLPLASFLKKGEYYYVGVSNTGVKTSGSDFISVATVDGRPDGVLPGLVLRGRSKMLTSSLGLALHGGDVASGRLLAGSMLEDLGNRRGLFSYSLRNDFSDVLDLDPASVLGDGTATGAFFDTQRLAAVAPISSGLRPVYAIPFGHPASSIQISGGGLVDGSGMRLEYSLDGREWKPVPAAQYVQRGPQYFSVSIAAAGATELFLRTSPDKAVQRSGATDAAPIFGLSQLHILAEISLP